MTVDDAARWHGSPVVLVDPIKVNYEIHENTLAHLHAHIYARFRGDRFVGGPIDHRLDPVDNVPLETPRAALS